MNLLIDNIIYTLQKAGGISVVWNELTKRLINDIDINLYFIDFESDNIFRKELSISNSHIIENSLYYYPKAIQRYLNPKSSTSNCLFHSSYYRIINDSKVKNITTVHDFIYEYYRKGIPKITHTLQKKKAINNSVRIICVSENTRIDLLKFYPEIKENKIKVIYNGVDNLYQPLLNKNEDKLKHLIPFSSGEFVLYVGDRKSLYKNFNVAVNACKLSNQPLVIVGGGILSEKEKHLLIEKLGIHKFKHLYGISNEQLNLIYNHAFCLLYPSLYEGFGIPILEAQRVGCPVISTNFSSIPEVAGKGAILLDIVTEYQIAEMLNTLKTDSIVVSNLRNEGFKNSQRFSWNKCYQQTKEVYLETYQEYF